MLKELGTPCTLYMWCRIVGLLVSDATVGCNGAEYGRNGQVVTRLSIYSCMPTSNSSIFRHMRSGAPNLVPVSGTRRSSSSSYVPGTSLPKHVSAHSTSIQFFYHYATCIVQVSISEARDLSQSRKRRNQTAALLQTYHISVKLCVSRRREAYVHSSGSNRFWTTTAKLSRNRLPSHLYIPRDFSSRRQYAAYA